MKKILAMAGIAVALIQPALASDDDLRELRASRDKGDWELIRNDAIRNIKTYGKQEDGKRIRSFKGEAQFDASLETMARIHFDVENYKKWFYEAKDMKLLKKVSNTEYYYYAVYNAPATLPDRDAVLHAVVEPYTAKKGYMLIRVNAVPDYLPQTPGLVRMTAQEMTVKLIPQGPNRTQLEFEGYVDPGGLAPVWAINFVQRRAPYVSMLGLTRMANSPTYTNPSGPSPFTISQ
ncbi:hypothetical protein EV700_2702 [Fluviicoccus keumensis]|uniref:START domain-containing protein n=1 Tax=Fluviicoccus keumensis TaxID=1435465 RepID=A0A4Q7YNB0_9GAMM|nr:START domain-containing protein [Fluviicoccus keumensis]RZU38125.1 hypothetical protein EV700_2702 [Fluviicoccus keumensis]